MLALFLGFAALVAQAIAPICLSGFPSSRSADGYSIVLCTAHGFQTVALDAYGKPLPPTPDKNAPDGQCPMCVAFHSAPLLGATAALIIAIAIFWYRADASAEPIVPLGRRAYASFLTRAPPVVVRCH